MITRLLGTLIFWVGCDDGVAAADGAPGVVEGDALPLVAGDVAGADDAASAPSSLQAVAPSDTTPKTAVTSMVVTFFTRSPFCPVHELGRTITEHHYKAST